MSSRNSGQVVPVKRQPPGPGSTTIDNPGTGTSTNPFYASTPTTSPAYSTPSVDPGSTSTPVDTSTISYPVSASTFIPAQTSTTAPTQSSTQSPAVAATSSTSNTGIIAGSVVGGVLFLALVVLAVLLYLRARKRRRTPPSAEFMNSHRAGATPVLRFDSGIEYTSTLHEKSGGHTHYPPIAPVPLLQNSYYTSPSMQEMKYPDELMVTDRSSRRPSAENTHHPQRFSSQANDVSHDPSTSIGSRRELWGSETEIVSNESSPVRLSPLRADPVLQFAPRFSLDEPFSQPLYPSHSPPSLQPLRRQPD